jgi:hypothetical protein
MDWKAPNISTVQIATWGACAQPFHFASTPFSSFLHDAVQEATIAELNHEKRKLKRDLRNARLEEK